MNDINNINDIVVNDLQKSFGDKRVLDHFSATFQGNGVTLVLGPSGCGKTTLLRILMGLERADGGDISGLSGKKIAAVFQEDRLLSARDALSNIRLVNKNISHEDVSRAMKEVGLSDCEKKQIATLSGGMRRRVAILRALLSEFDLLILDEPFKGLDDENKFQTAKFIKEKLDGRCAIVVTHDPSDGVLLGATGKVLVEQII